MDQIRQCVFFNGGKESLVILHKFMGNSLIAYIENEAEFPEIKEYINCITEKFNLNILKFNSIEESIMSLKQKGVDTVILGCRRTDPGCENLDVYQVTDEAYPTITRYHPLLDWTYQQVWDYIDQHKLPVCELYGKGYTSIGTQLNTFPNYTLFYGGTFHHAKFLSDPGTERIGRIKTNLPRAVSGTVIHGHKLGRTLGFPTANLNTNLNLLDSGVYYGTVQMEDIIYNMVMSTGVNPQFNTQGFEIHILHQFNEEFYGKILNVNVIGFIRPMKHYDTIALLIEAIRNDILIAQYLLK